MANFLLRCTHCGKQYDGGAGFRLRCDGEVNGDHGPALLRPAYERKHLRVRMDLPGIFKFADWLPTGPYYIDPAPAHLGEPYCYRSTGLAKRLGLNNLYIAFSGYWPERKLNLVTRTFKEFEVQASIPFFLQNFVGREAPPFIIASAGNTANSYNYHTHVLGLPLYLFVPESGLGNLLLPFETHPAIVAVDGDYTDAILLADEVADRCELLRDGGVLNAGRRGGMGAVMLNAVAHPTQGTRRLFDHYFQAVGSASGAIAAWEAVQLLLGDGRFGDTVTQIHMAQNAPFAPIFKAWKEGRKDLVPVPAEEAHRQVAAVTAGVLTNRKPPFGPAGGIRDVLAESNGAAWEVSNEQLFHGARMFRSLEGIDIGPAAAVAVQALCQAVESGRIKPADHILLHITGGGREIQYTEGKVCRAQPTLRVKPGDIGAVLAAIGKPEPVSAERIARTLRRYDAASGA